MIDILESVADLVFGTFERLGGPTVLLVLAFTVLPALFILHLVWWIRRPTAWQRVAKAGGFRYHNSDASLRRHLARVESLSGVSKGDVRCLNVITREVDDIWECVFDHTMGLNRKGATKNRTVYVARGKNLALPTFRLLQKRTLQGCGRGLDFEDDPKFSRLFNLHANDPESIRRFFDPKVRDCFKELLGRCEELERKSNRGLTRLIVSLTTSPWMFEVECADDAVVIFLSRYIQPDAVPEFLKLCETTFSVLRQAAPLTTSTAE